MMGAKAVVKVSRKAVADAIDALGHTMGALGEKHGLDDADEVFGLMLFAVGASMAALGMNLHPDEPIEDQHPVLAQGFAFGLANRKLQRDPEAADGEVES